MRGSNGLEAKTNPKLIRADANRRIPTSSDPCPKPRSPRCRRNISEFAKSPVLSKAKRMLTPEECERLRDEGRAKPAQAKPHPVQP